MLDCIYRDPISLLYVYNVIISKEKRGLIIISINPCLNIYSVKPQDIDLSKATIKRYSCFSPGDRATTINLDDSNEYALIETYQKVWIKYLLNHDYAEILEIWVIDDGNKKKT